MQDNSAKRRKTLIISVLAFLLAGGGVFLFFVIQGSNDLTSRGRKSSFTYGEAAREGVSSFFKSVGIIPDEDGAQQKTKEARMEARGFLPDGEKADSSVSDWMAKAPAPSASGSAPMGRPTDVPKMSAGAGSMGGGGGGTKSSGSTSRFGEGSGQGMTSVSNKGRASAETTTDKGTLGTLKRARALLGEGLRSDSAMNAHAKWGQSFGVDNGSNRGGDMAYSKSGLVALDKIKSGEIASLKTDKKGAGLVPDAGAFQRDKAAESKDAGIQAAKEQAQEKSKKDAEAEVKKDLIKGLGDAVTNSAGDKGGPSAAGAGTDPGKAPITDAEKDEAKNLAFFQSEKLSDGSSFQDNKVDIVRNPDGGATYKISGVMTVNGQDTPYTDVVVRGPDGKLTFQ